MTEPLVEEQAYTTNELLSPCEKCLALGSTGYSGIESVGWNDEELPNIVDYDVVIVDVRALDDAVLASVSTERFKTLRIQLTRLLFSGGRIIVVSDFKKAHILPPLATIIADNYSWSPINIGISDESGESRVRKEDRYPSYLKHLEQWPYYFFTLRDCLSLECIEYFGSRYADYRILSTAYIENRYGKIIAGSCIIEVIEHIRGTANKRLSGKIVLLPLIEKLDHKEAVQLVLEDLTGKTLGYTPPGWVDTVSVPSAVVVWLPSFSH